MTARLGVTYHVRSDAASIEARAQAIAVEQSVEMPLEAIDEPAVLRDIVGEVQSIEPLDDDRFAVRIGLATATIGHDAGQLLNMLFGNTSLHDDVVLHDVTLPGALVAAFGGPRHGIAGLRQRVGAGRRALTCSALKPQGLSAERLGVLAERFARGGIDYIKDDHGLAAQDYSRFEDRVRACAAGVARATRATGHPTRYVPSLSGDLNAMRRQVGVARASGLDCVLLAPLIAGFANMQALVAEFPDVAFFAHPSLGGAARIAPALLIGTLFRLVGADAVIFPNFGGRFGYSPDTCRLLADNARAVRDGMRASLPVPAGGMTLQRTPELLDFYGADAMLLIGGNLLLARERLAEETAAFTRAVAAHDYR
ncbi:MAG: RuBisCO large subunit C-terminal-like domain-containing protein [Acetobacteraceae bacterium]|jgi:ribulose-bisphosphate carboxylase large chain